MSEELKVVGSETMVFLARYWETKGELDAVKKVFDILTSTARSAGENASLELFIIELTTALYNYSNELAAKVDKVNSEKDELVKQGVIKNA